MASHYFDGYAVILGAGASFGASVGRTAPPLDGPFLAVARQVLKKNSADKKAWRKLVGSLEKAGIRDQDISNYRLEQLSTYLEARANMPSLQAKVGKPADYTKALEQLSQVICRTIEQTNGTKSCPIHRAVFDRVNPGCVITFNYDLIADQTLLAMDKLSWSKKEYAGSSLIIQPSSGKPYNSKKPKHRLPDAIRYLKLHGSINWQAHKKGDGFSLTLGGLPDTSKQFYYPGPPEDPMVVPPVAAKMQIRRGAIRELWSSASTALRTAPGWIIWGYSFPLTDTVTQVLCRTALAKHKKPKPIIVINPDMGVSERIRGVLQKVRVRNHWSSVERFLLDAEAIEIE